MKKRDSLKKVASEKSKIGLDSSEDWKSYKKIRNKINNKVRFEEKSFKLNKYPKALMMSQKLGAQPRISWDGDLVPAHQVSFK